MMEWEVYKRNLIAVMNSFVFDNEILRLLKESRDKNQKIFVAGNGGSASIASHYVCDFSKGLDTDWDKEFYRYKAISLSTNIDYITAISNDNNYDEIFCQQLINLSNPNDILVLISSSGNSKNIIKAARYAKQHKLILIGITGFDGGDLKNICDYSAHVNFSSYELVEDIHSIFGHFLSLYLKGIDSFIAGRLEHEFIG